eukprot:105672_1
MLARNVLQRHRFNSITYRLLSTAVNHPTFEHSDHIQGYMHLNDGEHIYFQSSGLKGLYEENIDKQSVVLLHGKKYHSQTWNQNETLQYLLKNKYGNIAFDMPGYGNSSGKTHDFGNANIEWIIQCLEKLKLKENIVLIMPSMSGLYGLQWIFDDTYSKYLSGIIPIAPAFCDEYNEELYKKVTVPTCIVYGENDETGLHHISNKYLMQIPNHKQNMIEGAPHACYLKSNADEFHKIMIDFVNELENVKLCEQ